MPNMLVQVRKKNVYDGLIIYILFIFIKLYKNINYLKEYLLKQ